MRWAWWGKVMAGNLETMATESFENLSYEDRTFAPSADFAAKANAKADIYELAKADVVITPQLKQMGSADFRARNAAILAGELATQEKVVEIKERLKKV